MGLFDKFKRKIPPMVQIFYNQDFGFLIVPNAVEKTMGCHISIEPTEKVMPDCSSDDLGNAVILFGVVKDYYKELKKNQAEAIPFCELPDIIIDKVAIWDTYKTDYTTFNICGHDIYVYDDELAKVIKQLSDRYRENVLMYYFLDMSDTEIAKLQNISRSGVFQNRHYALKQMKKSLEEEH